MCLSTLASIFGGIKQKSLCVYIFQSGSGGMEPTIHVFIKLKLETLSDFFPSLLNRQHRTDSEVLTHSHTLPSSQMKKISTGNDRRAFEGF